MANYRCRRVLLGHRLVTAPPHSPLQVQTARAGGQGRAGGKGRRAGQVQAGEVSLVWGRGEDDLKLVLTWPALKSWSTSPTASDRLLS